MRTLTVSKVILVNERGELLLVRRSETDQRRPLQWDVPGGHVDEGEDILQAAAREAQEEAGVWVPASQLKVSYALSKVRGGASITWIFSLARLKSTPSITLSHEHIEYQWMQPEQALAAIEYDIHHEMLTYLVENNLIGVADDTNK